MAKEISIEEAIEELERELADRRLTYPDLTRGPKPALKPDEADRRIARLESALRRLRRLKSDKQAGTGNQSSIF